MAYATVTTFTTGDLVTAAQINVIGANTTHVESLLMNGVAHNTYANGAEINVALGARAYSDANITLTTATWTALTLNQEDFDSNLGTQIHTTGGSNQNFTIPKTGKYQCYAEVLWTGNTTGFRALRIRNGSTTKAENYVFSPTATNGSQQVFGILDCTLSDVITFEAHQTSGGNLDVIQANTYGIHACVMFIGK